MQIDAYSGSRAAVGHLYVHVPFCLGKCGYCALYSTRGAPSSDLAAYPAAVFAELSGFERRSGFAPVPLTIYVGGGTPTALGPHLGALLSGLRARLDLSRLAEFTVETRPDLVTPEVASMLAANGVNRVSMGVQTFDAGALLALGRDSPPASAARAVAALRSAGIDNVGIDLIAGLPGVAPGRTAMDIREAAGLEPTHVSVYSLIVEPGTPVAKMIAEGGIEAPSDDALMDSIAGADAALSALGFRRYEISNYARPGRECMYNLAVWRGEDYLGLGPSAASRIGLERWTNAPDARGYLESAKNGAPFFRECEEMSPEDDVEGRFIFGLRLAEGVDPRAFSESHPAASTLLPRWEAALGAARRQGLAEQAGPRWRLTPRGREVADSVMEMLVG